MLYYPQTNRQEVYEMTAPKKPPITKSFGYAFEGIFTCIRKERNMKISPCSDRRHHPEAFPSGMVHLSWPFRTGDGTGAGEHRRRIRGGSGDQRVQAPGEDRQGHRSRRRPDRRHHGRHRRTDHFRT